MICNTSIDEVGDINLPLTMKLSGTVTVLQLGGSNPKRNGGMGKEVR
jgi:hypothetical protein